jgi:hypothetical protein
MEIFNTTSTNSNSLFIIHFFFLIGNSYFSKVTLNGRRNYYELIFIYYSSEVHHITLLFKINLRFFPKISALLKI